MYYYGFNKRVRSGLCNYVFQINATIFQNCSISKTVMGSRLI